MNLTWHIVRKDLQRFWVPLALLSAVSLIRIGIGISLLTAGNPEPKWFAHMAIYANVLWCIGLFLTYMLAAAVVHEDSVAGPAFWQTRPISGSRLLAAKAIGTTFMFGLLPVLLSIPWWLGCGFGWSEIWRAGAEILAIQCGVVLLALPWAVVTGQYDRFLLWSLVAAVAWITGASFLFAQKEFATPSALPTRIFLIGVPTVAGCLCVAIHQFATRKTGRSVVLIVVTALSVAAAGRWSTWDAPTIWYPKPAAPTELTKDIKISLGNAYGWPTTNGYGVAELNLVAESVPPTCVLSPLYSEQSLHWADGSFTTQKQFDMWANATPSSATLAYRLLRIVPEPRDRSWARYEMRHHLVPLSRLDPKWKGKTSEPFTLTLSPETMRRLNDETPRLDGTYWFRLFEPVVIGETKISAGNSFGLGPIRSRISSVYNDENRQVLWVSFLESSPEYFWTNNLVSSGLAAPQAHPAYGVVNEKRTFAIDSLNETRAHALIADVAIVLRKDGFRSPNRWNTSTHRWEMERGIFEKATLAEVDFLDVGRFSAPLEADHLDFRGIRSNLEGELKHGVYTVTGEVTKAGTFVFSSGTTLVNALQAAGGVSDRADLSKVTLVRTTADGVTSTEVVNVEAWLEDAASTVETIPKLRPGDEVDVPIFEPVQSLQR